MTKKKLHTLLKTIMLENPKLNPQYGTNHALGVIAAIFANPYPKTIAQQHGTTIQQCKQYIKEFLKFTKNPSSNDLLITVDIVDTLATLADVLRRMTSEKDGHKLAKRYREFRALPKYQGGYPFMHNLVTNAKQQQSLDKLLKASEALIHSMNIRTWGAVNKAKGHWLKEARDVAKAEGYKRHQWPTMFKFYNWFLK
jgi:ribosomal protein S6